MSWVLIASGLWVLAATAVAFLPMRTQYAPGLFLLVVAPILMYFLAKEHGAVVFALALAAFLSMFRRPLTYFARRMLGRQSEPRE
ncbi:DUF2484 family protein [Aliiroseovarius sp.]|uniref:DUF2484 family protein n=1 Tax=Aliiroseovarius sp. TaxID=1872442 RepID=UPI0026120A31|nr:DUF2484 family protein [Aliiroseovarius sp.]